MSALSAAEQLRVSLDAIAGALLTPNLEALLAAEHGLASALTELGRVRGVDPKERPQMRRELDRARVALARCRRFGTVLDAAAHAALTAQGRSADYDRAGGRPMRAPMRGSQLRTRV